MATVPPQPRLLDEPALRESPVVANATMNRERGLDGVNSYARELRINPLDLLRARLSAGRRAAWLDLCCGRGRALVEAGRRLRERGMDGRAVLVGVDLVPLFDPVPPDVRCVRLVGAALEEWSPAGRFDLITCVHGLHYIGDKLGLLRRAAAWLAGDGVLVAHLDDAHLLLPGAKPGRTLVAPALRAAGFTYDRRGHLVRRSARGAGVRFPYRYVGADDAAGPNYTRQPAVASYYVAAPAG